MRRGIFLAVLAYSTWGLFPVFWKALHTVPWQEVTAHRMVWAALFFAAILRWRLGGEAGTLLRAALRRHVAILALTAFLIGSNWLIYIYAVDEGRVIEASLGYFINPLLSVVLGMLFLGERLRPAQWAAVALATAGVVQMAWNTGQIPYLGLWLALTFALYGLFRKKLSIEPLVASTLESLLMSLPAAVFLLSRLASPAGVGAIQGAMVSATPHDPSSVGTTLLLLIGGAVTALPLWSFVEAAKRIPLSTLGFLQYISPSLQFCLAVFVYGEAFTHVHAWTFGCIWGALGIYSVDLLLAMHQKASRAATAPEDALLETTRSTW